MSNPFQELRNNIAKSIDIIHCTFDELAERDFLKNTSCYGIDRMIMRLENIGAIYYRGEKMFIYKKWAKKNL